VPLARSPQGTHSGGASARSCSIGLVGNIGQAANQALVPDLLPREAHEAGYAAVRVVQNLGVTMGPPLGGLLLLGSNWTRFFMRRDDRRPVSLSARVALIPARGSTRTDTPPGVGSFGTIVRDRVFLLFFVSGTFSTLVYVAYETLLPISLVDSHGLAPSTWGFLVVVNPLMVTLFQLRITARNRARTRGAEALDGDPADGPAVPRAHADGALPIVAAVIFVFVIGEMLWIPTSQAVVARIAPRDMRGAYIGAFGSTFAIGFALTPFFGLQVRGAAGDAAMWILFASLAVVGARSRLRRVHARVRSDRRGRGRARGSRGRGDRLGVVFEPEEADGAGPAWVPTTAPSVVVMSIAPAAEVGDERAQRLLALGRVGVRDADVQVRRVVRALGERARELLHAFWFPRTRFSGSTSPSAIERIGLM
jgi:hypothetical protein